MNEYCGVMNDPSDTPNQASKWQAMKTKIYQKIQSVRKGFSLVELLIAVVVLGILGAMLIAAGTASQNRARVAVAQNDIDSVRNAVYQAFLLHPEIMQMTTVANGSKAAPTEAVKKANFQNIVDYISNELDETWRWTELGMVGDGAAATSTIDRSGPAAQTTNHNDPWGNPYGLYIYTDENTEAYNDADGNPQVKSDSCVYIIICSAGTNGTGGPMGLTGDALDRTTGALDRTLMVCHTDGIDDIGVVVRIKNGNTTMSTFGWDGSTLGTLKNVIWNFGPKTVSSVNNEGVYHNSVKDKNHGASIDQFPDQKAIDAKNGTYTAKDWGLMKGTSTTTSASA